MFSTFNDDSKLEPEVHPHLEPNYTGDERTHGWNIFCWPFLTKTKREWPFSGHFQSKFLLGALHFALCFFDPKIYDFWGKNRAAVWLHLYSWTWIDLTNISDIKFWVFFFFLVPLLLVWNLSYSISKFSQYYSDFEESAVWPRAASSQKCCSHNQPPAGCPGPDSGFLKVWKI